MARRWPAWIALLGIVGSACSHDAAHDAPVTPCVADESAPVPERASYAEWQKVELPGTTCSDASQYKFFVQYSRTSNDVLVLFEFGASCWDYESCTTCGLSTFCATAQLKGYTNQHGIADTSVSSGKPYAELAADWQADLALLRGEYAGQRNLAYYMPYFRADSCSHIVTLPATQHLTGLVQGTTSPWFGSEIAEDGSDVSTFTRELLDDALPLHSHFERSHSDGEYDATGIMDCRTQGTTMALPVSSAD
jgi:hypothetical protein